VEPVSEGSSADKPGFAPARQSVTVEAPQKRGFLSGVLPILGYLALTLIMTFPLVRQFGSAIPGDSFDGWQNYWNLWWVKVALLDKITSPWFTDLLYYPTGVSLLFHTLNPFNGITFLPVQLAFGLFPAYNTAVVLSFVMGGLGAYLLARYVLGPGSSRLVAFVAGAIFTFAPYHIAHLLGHMQLIALEWLPFFALYLLRAAGIRETRSLRRNRGVRGRSREIALATLFLVLVALCDWYYVFYCLILTAVVAAWCVVRDARAKELGTLRGRLIAIAAIWLAASIVLSPLLVPMVREARTNTYMVPNVFESRTFSADLLAFFTPQGFHPLWGEWARKASSSFTATGSEYTVFAGYTVLALAIAGLFTRRGRGSKWLWLAVALTFGIFALGPILHINGQTAFRSGGRGIPLPYRYLVRLPIVNIMRSISRFDVMVMLALAMLAAMGLDVLARGRRRGWLPAAALVLVLFEFLPAPYPMSPPDVPGWYTTLAHDPRPGAVLVLPMHWDRPGYLLQQTVYGKPQVAGYISRDDPRTLPYKAPVLRYFRRLEPDPSFDMARDGEKALAELGVRWVVLDRYQMPSGEEREVTDAGARQIFGDRKPVYEDDRLTVYEVNEPATAQADVTN
jgi:hypothetical protein